MSISKIIRPYTIATILTLFSITGNAGVDYFYTPSPIGNISGKAFSDPTGPIPDSQRKKMTWTVYNILPPGSSNQSTLVRDASVNTPINGWNLGDFTGAYAPGPLGSYQRGGSTTSYGGNSVAMFDFTDSSGVKGPIFSSMLNTFSQPYFVNLPATDPRCKTRPPAKECNHAHRNIAGSILSYTFLTTENRRPFAKGPNSVLRYSFMLQVPSVYLVGDARAHIGPSFTLEDTRTGQYLWFGPWVFNQGVGTENNSPGDNIGWDQATNSAIVGSVLRPGMKYLTVDTSSAHATNMPWRGWRWFGYSVSHSQIKQALSDVNAYIDKRTCRDINDKDGDGNRDEVIPCLKFSTNPEDFKIGQILMDAELPRTSPTGAGYIGFSTYGIWVYSTY